MKIMGLDIGTTGCKALVFDELGKTYGYGYREYPVIYNAPGHAELDAEQVVSKCFEVITEAAADTPEEVSAIGISSQGEAFVALDSSGSYLCNAMVSSDQRSAEISQNWPDTFGVKRLYDITGHSPHPMHTLFKVLWFRHNRKELFDKTSHFFCFEDLIQYKLGVESPAMGYPLAGRTMLFDIKEKCWSSDILAATCIEEKQLSSTLPSGTKAGNIDKTTARKLRLNENCAVVTGGHDQVCSALGAGVVESGTAMYAPGTVECICPVMQEAVFADNLLQHNLCTYDYSLQKKHATVAFSLTGGNLFKWFRDSFGQQEKKMAQSTGKDSYKLLLDSIPERPTDLSVLPYFTPSGTPYFDLNTRGTITGLRLSTKREEILKGLLESVAFEMRLNLQILSDSGIEVNSLHAVGGGCKSDRLMQLKADVLGKEIIKLDESEGGCKGAAILAAAAVSKIAPAKIASDWARTVGIIRPDKGRAEVYSEKFSQYKRLYKTMKDFYTQDLRAS